VWHDSLVCATWLAHVCDMTLSYVWHDSSIYVTWLIRLWDMTHSSVTRARVTWCRTFLLRWCHTYAWVDIAYIAKSCHTHISVMSHMSVISFQISEMTFRISFQIWLNIISDMTHFSHVTHCSHMCDVFAIWMCVTFQSCHTCQSYHTHSYCDNVTHSSWDDVAHSYWNVRHR